MERNEQTIQKIKEYCMHQAGAYESRPFGKNPICYRIMGKIFAQFNEQETFFKLTLKCDAQKAQIYRSLYPDIVVRGYHCPPVQQPYWNTIDLNLFKEEQMLFQMIDEAYEAVAYSFSKKAKLHLAQLIQLEFKDTDGENEDFAKLCESLDADLGKQVGENYQRKQYEKYNKRDTIHDVIIVYQNETPVACGAFKMYDEEHAELKRIYTTPFARNTGLASELVRRLEAKAKMKGYKWCILETGKPLEAACHVYQKAGYKVIPNYGQYACMPNSICMERKI